MLVAEKQNAFVQCSEEDQFPFVGTVSVCSFRGRYCEESHAQREDAEKTLFKPEREIIALENEEVRALEQVAVMKRKNGLPLITHANLIVFLVHTGLRCGELQALKRSDIDFCSKTVTVEQEPVYGLRPRPKR